MQALPRPTPNNGPGVAGKLHHMYTTPNSSSSRINVKGTLAVAPSPPFPNLT